MVSTYFKSALLDFAVVNAPGQASIYDTLGALCNAGVKQAKGGTFVVSFSDGATQSSRILPTGTQAVTPSQVIEAFQELRYLWRQCERALKASGVTDPQQEDVKNELQALLDQAPTEATCDFSELKLPNNFNVIHGT